MYERRQCRRYGRDISTKEHRIGYWDKKVANAPADWDSYKDEKNTKVRAIYAVKHKRAAEDTV